MRDKLGRFTKGNISWSKLHPEFMPRGKKHCRFGKTHTKIARKKISIGHKGKPTWNKGKKLPQFSREKAGHWKGGQTIKNGYIFIYKPEHPFCNQRGYVKRAHLVMEQKLGRYIKPKEIVHHINEIKDDDRIENLKLLKNIFEHNKIHPRNRNNLGQFL